MTSTRALHLFARLTAAATFVLLAAGSLVTSTDSGLAVPDWPLSYGTWFPPMVGGILYEHGHRMIAAVVAVMILGLTVWTHRVEPRRWVRRLADAALCGVILQAVLGGLTVLLMLPPHVSIAHACVGPAVFCLVAALAWSTQPGWELPRHASRRLRVSALAAGAAAAVQLVLGAVVRHTGGFVGAHMAGAAATTAAVIWYAVCAGRVRGQMPRIWRFARRLVGLVILQLVLGMLVFVHRDALALRTAHAACGWLLLMQAVLSAWQGARLDAPAGSRIAWTQRVDDYLELSKARLSALVLLTTGVGFWLGIPRADQFFVLVPLGIGMTLVVAGANALNQWMESGRDALMQRTRHRPVPSGRMSPRAAFTFGAVCSVTGLLALAIGVNVLSAGIAAVGWASYVLLYTPLKQVTPLCTLVGAVPGAVPPLIGWAAARGSLSPDAWVLFAILFVWQLPHFLSLAVLYREDYAHAGFPMLPLVEANGSMTARQTALYGLALIPISLFPTLLGLAGRSYFFGAAILSGLFFWAAARAAWRRSPQTARQLFHASVVYLPILLVWLAMDRLPR